MPVAKGKLKKRSFRRPSFPAALAFIILTGLAGYARILYLEGTLSFDFIRKDPSLRGGESAGASSETGGYIYVHIDGEVRRPGLYRIREGERLGHLIEEAGGLTSEAASDALNFAARLTDGLKVVIPKDGLFRRMGIGEAPPPTYIKPPIIPERVYGP